MSYLTPCNFCTLRRMRERAARRGTEVVLSADGDWIAARYADAPPEAAPAVLFRELSDDCVC